LVAIVVVDEIEDTDSVDSEDHKLGVDADANGGNANVLLF